MEWILIVIIVSAGWPPNVAVESIEFNSQEACEFAKASVIQVPQAKIEIAATCVSKSIWVSTNEEEE